MVAVDVQAKAGNVSKGHLEELQMNACPWVRVNCNVGTPVSEQIDHVHDFVRMHDLNIPANRG